MQQCASLPPTSPPKNSVCIYIALPSTEACATECLPLPRCSWLLLMYPFLEFLGFIQQLQIAIYFRVYMIIGCSGPLRVTVH